MVKSIITVSIDSDLVELAHKEGLNISGECNTYLKSRLLGSALLKDNSSEDLQKMLTESEARTISIRKQLESTDFLEKAKKKEEFSKKLKELLK